MSLEADRLASHEVSHLATEARGAGMAERAEMESDAELRIYVPRVFRYAAPIDLWLCRDCVYAPWQAHDTDDPSCRDLDRCPHCGFDGDEQRLLRFRLRCCR